MTSAVKAVGGQLARVLRATLLFFVAIPINVLTAPAGAILFAFGSLLELVAPEAGSNMRMTGLRTIEWGWDWWPVAVDIELAD